MRIVRKDFIAWLKSYAPKTIVGTVKESCNCPIANYLKFQGIKNPEVYEEVWIPEPNRHSRKIPRWASKFIGDIDECHKHKGISAGVCLKFLGD